MKKSTSCRLPFVSWWLRERIAASFVRQVERLVDVQAAAAAHCVEPLGATKVACAFADGCVRLFDGSTLVALAEIRTTGVC